MATLVLRTVKGVPLTNEEVDGNFSNINSEVGVVNSNVGVLTNLVTTAKGNLVAAINNAVSDANANLNLLSANVGNLSALSTTAKGNLVAAINEIALESTSTVSITGGTISGTTGWTANVIGVLYGGTGANTAGDARVNLGLGTIATQNANIVTITGGTITGVTTVGSVNSFATNVTANTSVTAPNIVSSSNFIAGSNVVINSNRLIFPTAIQEARVALASANIDVSSGTFFTRTISGATSFTYSNVPAAGLTASFVLDLTNGGSATVTWWAGLKWVAGAAPTLTAAGRDVLGFFTHDGGTTWTGLLLGKDVK